MTGPTDLELMRLLRGELPPEEARRLRARLLEEPELAEAYRRLEAVWRSLEPPPPSPVPPGFSTRVMARVRESAAGRASWASAPGWVRATAAAALVTGIAIGWTGAGAGSLRPGAAPTPAPAAVAVPERQPAAEAVETAGEETAPPATSAEALPERSPATAPAAPIIAGVTEEETEGPEQEELFDWDGDLADSYWEAVASLSTATSETGAATDETDETGETGGALP